MKDYEDFDLQIRSSLENAEEQVPSRIWSGISSRLDAIEAASAPAHTGRKWGWTAAGIAVAAALATGIFFVGTNDHNSNLINNKENGLVALVDPVQAAAAESQEDAVLPSSDIVDPAPSQLLADNATQPVQQIAPKQQTEPKQQSTTRQSEPKTPVTVENQAEKVGDSVNATEAVKENEVVDDKKPVAEEVTAPVEPAASSTAVQNEAPEADPFTQMAFEDARSSKHRFHTSAYAGGSLAGNGASGSDAIAMGVSGRSLNELQETSESSYGIPLSLGAGVRFHFAPRWSVGTGLDYSLLTRTFSGTYGSEQIVNSDIRHTVQYLGIPVNLYYNIFNSERINFYVFGGGEAEYCLSNKYKILESGTTLSDPIKKLQYSVGGGLGVEFKVGKGVGLYLDPSARYYFDCGQPKSIRTEKPFMVTFQAGLRFNL